MGTTGEKQNRTRFDDRHSAWWNMDRLEWWHFAVIGVVALLCYVQTAGYGFIWDDNVQISLNPRIRSFANFGKAFTENFWAFRGPQYYTNYFRPMHTLTYMIGYVLGGLSPAPYHWISIVLHVLTSLTVCFAGAAFLRSPTAAFWGALLFAVHPMHTESVSWVAGITDVGCGLFYVLSLGAFVYLRARKGPTAYWWTIALISFFLSLLYKEMALTLPLVILLLDFACDTEERGLRPGERLRRLLPFLALLAVYVVLRIRALGVFSKTRVPLPMSFTDKLLTVTYFVGHYIQDLLVPIKQSAYHVFLPFSRLSVKDWLLPFALLAVGIGLVFRYLRNDRRSLFLALMTVLTLIPILYLGGVGDNKYTERYLYLPSMGFCLLVASLIERYLGKKKAGMALCALLVLALAFLTIRRNPVWKDESTFYRTTLAASPGAVQMNYNLGVLLLSQRNYPAARAQFQSALDATYEVFAYVPLDRAEAYLGLCEAENGMGHLQAAAENAEKALGVVPDLADASLRLGTLKGRLGDYTTAEKLLRQALTSMPENALAHSDLGNVLFYKNDFSSAEQEYWKAIQLDSRFMSARISLAVLLARTGRGAEAISVLREVLTLDPANLQARQLLEQVMSRAVQVQ
jgi:tetratricopeptide (TPR) repeat protein